MSDSTQAILGVMSWDFVSKAADLVGLVTFLFTGGVFFIVREIRRTILYKARGRELLEELVKHRSSLNTFLTTFAESSQEFQRQLALIEVTLQALENKVGWYLSGRAKSVRRVRKLVAARRNGNLDRTAAENVYNEVAIIAGTLEQDWRDRQWLV